MRKTDLESKLSLLTEILKRQDFDTISFSVELTKTKEPDKRIYLEVSETIETLKHDKSQKRIEYIIDRMLGGLIGHLEPGFLYELENAANHNEARRILIDKFKKDNEPKKEPLNAVIREDGTLITGLEAHRRMREIVKIPIERFVENTDSNEI